MNPSQWLAVDDYLLDLFGPDEPALKTALEAALEDSRAAGLPAINVSPCQGRFLWLVARLLNARHILEIGTLGGYSTIWLASAQPGDGTLITLESEAKHAEVARANIARAGLSAVVDLRLGLALDTLPQLAAERRGPFDLVFIDADKENGASYFQWALRLSRRGSLIVCDNVVRKGAVIDADSDDPKVPGTRRALAEMAGEARAATAALQMVGSKGYDGMTFSLVTVDPG